MHRFQASTLPPGTYVLLLAAGDALHRSYHVGVPLRQVPQSTLEENVHISLRFLLRGNQLPPDEVRYCMPRAAHSFAEKRETNAFFVLIFPDGWNLSQRMEQREVWGVLSD